MAYFAGRLLFVQYLTVNSEIILLFAKPTFSFVNSSGKRTCHLLQSIAMRMTISVSVMQVMQQKRRSIVNVQEHTNHKYNLHCLESRYPQYFVELTSLHRSSV